MKTCCVELHNVSPERAQKLLLEAAAVIARNKPADSIEHKATLALMWHYASALEKEWTKTRKLVLELPRNADVKGPLGQMFSKFIEISEPFFTLAYQIGKARALRRIESRIGKAAVRSYQEAAKGKKEKRSDLQIFRVKPPRGDDEDVSGVLRAPLKAIWKEYHQVYLEQQERQAILNAIHWNSNYFRTSFQRDMNKAASLVIDPAEMAGVFEANAYRVMNYSEALWTKEEAAFKQTFINMEKEVGPGLRLDFVGPSDGESCEGCIEAVAGSPYAAANAPVPGTLNCYDNCRHWLIDFVE